MRTKLRSKVTLLFLTLGLLLAIPAIALADNAVADGDGVTPLTDNPTMAFGNVGCNVASTNKALIAINRTGSGTNVFQNGAVVTVTAAATGNAALSAAMDSSTITLPSNWGSLANNTLSDSVSSTVTVNSSTPGAGSGTVTYTASGLNNSNNTITRTDTVDVTWTTGSCDTTAPSVSSISTANTNPTNTNGNLSWNVTFSESVTGVDASDFNLVNTGLGGTPAITSVTPSSGPSATYTVTASSGTGSGTLGLNLTDNDSIKDAANNPLGGTGSGNGNFIGDVYTIDRTVPTMTGSAVLGPDFTAAYTADTWTNQDVRVTFACADTGGSGLTSGSGNDVQNFTTETDADGVEATSGGTCADNAGNTAAAATFSPIKIDKINPTITGSASPPPNGANWNNTPVTVSFNCGDALSGVASCPADVTLSSNGADQSASGTATDEAGNSASTTVGNIDIDQAKPDVTVTGVSNGATYTLGSVPTAGCNTTDQAGLSGVKTNATLQPLSGGPVGAVTATCSGAEDNAGNTNSASVTYNVVYNWTGFFRPVDNPTIVNTVKAGQSIPVKFSLSGNQGLNIFYVAKPSDTYQGSYPASQKVACDNSSTDAIEETVTAGNSSLSYDATADQYNYVWKTEKGWAGTCRLLTVKLADGSEHVAEFKFLK